MRSPNNKSVKWNSWQYAQLEVRKGNETRREMTLARDMDDEKEKM